MKWRQAKKKRVVRKRHDAIKKGKMLFQELEPRVLYSADAIGGADAILDTENVVALVVEWPAPTENEVAAVENGAETPPPVDLSAFSAEAKRELAREVVFVDTDTPDYQLLVDDLLNNAGDGRQLDVFILDNARDGIEQISNVLASYESLDAVHIISHGDDGSVDLGNTRLDIDALNVHAVEIASWAGAFAETGDFLIYGCNLAAGADGQSFVDMVARLTETDVAASDDLTGNLLLGGDWDLEFRTGDIETGVVISEQVQNNWAAILANSPPALAGANDLTAIDEDPLSNGGTLVSDLIAGQVTDGDPGALTGIAVVAVDNNDGEWEFSTDSGSTWTAFGSPDVTAARLLAAQPDTFVRFQPGPNWNGTVTDGLTFHAWDQTSAGNGDVVNIETTDNVRDEFNVDSYNLNDGSAVWTSVWLEFDDDNVAATGNVRIDAGKLRLDNNDFGTPESVSRAVDLSTASHATLSFDYEAFGAILPDPVAIEISNDGGTNWTLLETINIVGADSGSRNYDLDSAIALTSDMELRFRLASSLSLAGAGQFINFDNVDISYAGVAVDPYSPFSVASVSSSITVNAVNDPAVIGGVDTGVVTEDVAIVGGNLVTMGTLTITDTEVGEDSFIAATLTNVGELTLQTNGIWSYSVDNALTAIQEIGNGESIVESFTISSLDGTTHELKITILGTNDTPIISGTFTGVVNEGDLGDPAVTAVGTIAIADVDINDSPTFNDQGSTPGDNAYGDFVLTGGTWTYTLDQSAVQDLDLGDMVNDTITYTATDGTTRQITVTITGTDDISVITGTVAGAVSEGNIGDAPATAGGILTVTDVDGDDTPYFADMAATPGDNGYGSFVLNAGTWTFTLDQSAVQNLDAGDVVVDTITYTATDIDVATLALDSAASAIDQKINGVHRLDNGNFIISAEKSANLGGLNFGPGDLVEYNPGTDTATLYFDGSNLFADPNTNVSAFHILDNGHIVLGTDSAATLGGLSFSDLDLVEYDPGTGTASLYFDGALAGINKTITALHILDNGNLVIGAKSGWSIGGTSFGVLELAEYDPVAKTAALYSDLSAPLQGAGTKLGALHILDNGNLMFTTLGSATIGGVDFEGRDLVEYNPNAIHTPATQQITVTITGTDDSSVVTGVVTGAVLEGDLGDTVTAVGTLAIADVDDDDSPTFADVVSTPGDNNYGDFVLSAGVWTYTLDQSAVQDLDALDVVTDTITYTASDGTRQQITVTITGTDDSSVVTGVVTGAVLEGDIGDTVTASGTLAITDADTDDNPSFADTTVTLSYGSVTMTSGTWTYVVNQSLVQDLDAGDVVNDFVLFTASDGTTQGVTITITGTNDASVVTGTFTGATAEGNIGGAPSTAVGSIAITDLDQDDTPVFGDIAMISGDNGYGSFSLVAGTWTYTLNQTAVQYLDAGDSVVDTVSFVASDGNARQISVTIVGTVDAPTTVGIAALAVNEDAPVTTIDLASAFDDFEDADSALTYTVTSNTNSSLFSGINSTGTKLSLAYTPDASGVANVTLRATDTQGGFVETTFKINVSPINDAPILSTNTGAMVGENETITLTAAALGASDIDNVDAEIVYTLTNNPVGGTLHLGGVELGVGASFTQADIDTNLVTFLASDDALATGVITFTVTDVAGANIGVHEFNITIESGSSEDEAVAFIEDENARSADLAPEDESDPDRIDPAEDSKNPPEETSQPLTNQHSIPEAESRDVMASGDHQIGFDDRRISFADLTGTDRFEDGSSSTIQKLKILAEAVSEIVEDPDSIDVTEEEKIDRITHALQLALDSLGSELDDAAASQIAHDQVMMAVGHIGGASISAGVLAWLFRAGSLLASVLSVMPLWARMDPLPVLLAKKRRDDDENLDEDEKEAARILDGNSARESKELAQ